MYKTVRHGENCLQYKILAQQEEGQVNVKCGKSQRTITAKLITVIILLIVGIIASAVLVPLVLTNDFIALTGTFQKFSVSTLRRSHSGNHVVVIAKKPYGWSAPHPSVSTRLPNASQNHSNDVKKSMLRSDLLSTTSEPVSTIETTKTITSTSLSVEKIGYDQPGRTGKTENPIAEQDSPSTGISGRELELTEVPSTTALASQQQKSFQGNTTEIPEVSSTLGSVWFGNDQKWNFISRRNLIQGLNRENTKSLLMLAIFFVVVVLISFIVLRKTLPNKRNLIKREAAEFKEDKTRLLKLSGSSDHDEE